MLANVDGIAELNSIRYRGYYWDEQTWLYYLQSRYYDSEVGRFLSPDDVGILDISKNFVNGLNLYSYCFNDPINLKDSTGYFPEPIQNPLLGFAQRLPHVTRNSRTTVWQFPTPSRLIGNLTRTQRLQNRSPNGFFTFSSADIVTGALTSGIGLNLFGFLGLELFGVSGGSNPWDVGIGVDGNIGAFNFGVGIGLGGVNISLGWAAGNYLDMWTLEIGWGTMALAAVAVVAAPKALAANAIYKYATPVVVAVVAPVRRFFRRLFG